MKVTVDPLTVQAGESGTQETKVWPAARVSVPVKLALPAVLIVLGGPRGRRWSYG